MKKLVFIAIVLCSCAIACRREDTSRTKGWRRTTEPRFTGADWVPCKDGACDEKKPRSSEACEGQIPTHAAAVDLLLSHDECLDNAIAALEGFRKSNPAAKSDLAAAYYVRATRHDRQIDFLNSLEAADGDSPAAIFNRALAQESLGLYDDSIETWEKVAKTNEKEWAAEAAEHAARLRALLENDAEKRWAAAVHRLPKTLQPEDRPAVAALVAEFPFSTQKYFERFAEPKNLENSRLFAAELSLRLKDSFDLDVIRAIDRASPDQRDALVEGHRLLTQGYDFAVALTSEPAIEAFAKSARQFERARSPFFLLAELGRANALSFEDSDQALLIIDKLESVAAKNGYRHLLARLHANRSNILFFAGRPFDALSAVKSTLDEFDALSDQEGHFRNEIATIGYYRTIGENDLSWQQALLLVRTAQQVPDGARRHPLYGDAAATVATLNFPRIALSYQNIPIRQLQLQLAGTIDIARIQSLQKNLGIGLRARAGIEVQLGLFREASEDFNEATRLLAAKEDDPIARSLLTSLEAAKGEALLKQSNPAAAAATFTNALNLNKSGKYHTLRARLLAQRGVALRRAGYPHEAQTSLQAALDELRLEEAGALRNRFREIARDSLNSYFARFQDTYRLLIAQLVEEHDAAKAFRYAERARGYEPLNLLSQRPTAPKSLRSISSDGEAVKLEDIQKALPAGTFLFEYCVLEEYTFVWVISHDQFDIVTLPVTLKKLKDWSKDIQAAALRNPTTFNAVLAAQYEHLIEAPLAMARKMNDGRPPTRLVIIPDGPMHGLPLGASRKNAPGFPYLLQEMPIEIDGSASLYLASLLRDRDLQSSASQKILLIGNPFVDPKRGKFGGLAGAEKEVADLADLYKPDAISRIGSNATIPEFMRLAIESAVIHVAAHGIVDATAPSRSAILLARSPGNDGALDAETLLKELQLNRTHLVVLSACTSAGGLPVGPEGVAPLVRPIIAAGASAVIGSLWQVDDATSAELFVSFHKHYRKGSDAAMALRAAQLEMLDEKPGDVWPAMTWGAFQVIGHASSPFASHTTQQKEKPP